MKKDQRTQECDNASVGEATTDLEALSVTDLVGSSNSSSQHLTEVLDLHAEARQDMKLLISVVANKQNIDFIKQKLLSTLEYRSEMLRNNKTDLRVEFPYFFTYPELVCLTLKIFVHLNLLNISNIVFFRYFMISELGIRILNHTFLKISGKQDLNN